MAQFVTEGIIIKRSNFGEADRILTILTPFRGKIKVIAKGVRRITSRRGGNVESLNKVRMQLFKGSGLSILTEAESIETYPKIKSDLVVLTYATHVAELIDRLIPEDQLNPTIYKLFEIVLTLLEKNPRQIFIRAFEVKLLSDLGFWSIDQVEVEGEIKKLLEDLDSKSWVEISQMEVTPEQSLELERILRYYMEKVLEGSLKSLKLLKQLKDNK